MEQKKIVLVGDSAVGKSSILSSITSRSFTYEYHPTVFDTQQIGIMHEEKYYLISLWDTNGKEKDSLRTSMYFDTDVFFICYSLNDKISFHNAVHKWHGEIKPFLISSSSRSPSFFFVATKTDLSPRHLKTDLDKDKICKDLGAKGHLECSSLREFGVYSLFTSAIQSSLPLTSSLLPAHSTKKGSSFNDEFPRRFHINLSLPLHSLYHSKSETNLSSSSSPPSSSTSSSSFKKSTIDMKRSSLNTSRDSHLKDRKKEREVEREGGEGNNQTCAFFSLRSSALHSPLHKLSKSKSLQILQSCKQSIQKCKLNL